MFIQQILVLETSPISKKKIGLITIKKIFCYCFSFDLQTLLLFRALKICQRMHIDDFTKISIENLFEFWVHIIHGTSFFSAFYTQLWGCVLYKGAYYTQTCTCSTYLFNVLQFFNAMSNKNFWQFVTYYCS